MIDAGPQAPLGILAGGTLLPVEIAEAARGRGRSVHIVGLEGEADPAIARYPHTWVNWGAIDGMISAFRLAGCREIVIVGRVRRPNLLKLRPDGLFWRTLPYLFRFLRGGDDTILRLVISFFERHGLTVRGVADVAPELVAPLGPIAGPAKDGVVGAGIVKARAALSALGPFDAAQAAVADTSGRLIAIEGADGTDAMLRRLAATRISDTGGVMVKMPKMGQELRIDLPTIGPDTVRRAVEAKLDCIAIGAGSTIIADRAGLAGLAVEAHVAVVGIDDTDSGKCDAAGSSPQTTAVRPPPDGVPVQDLQDALLGLRVLDALEPFWPEATAIVSRGYVLALEGPGGAVAAAERSGRLKPWGARLLRRRVGVVVTSERNCDARALTAAAARSGLAGILASASSAKSLIGVLREQAIQAGLFVAVSASGMQEGKINASQGAKPLRLFVVAGEHSGDTLGAKLIAALQTQYAGPIVLGGVGGELMQAEGLESLFPLSDVAVMGPMAILARLPRIVRRVYQTVDAAVAFGPDAVVIVDSPEFTHPLAKRIRRRRPDIPIIDYVSPTIWAWRPGRARKMRPYVDHVLALLPFEPDAHARLGGPRCTYVGHPLIERRSWLAALDTTALAARTGVADITPALVVLPGSRASEVGRLIGPFGEAVQRLVQSGQRFVVLLPTVPHLETAIREATAQWPVPVHVLLGDEDKFAAFKLARAALAASGTVTLELALAGTPMVVGYSVDPIGVRLRFLVKTDAFALANLVVGQRPLAFPELMQEDCTPDKLAAALAPLLSDTPERAAQLAALATVPLRLDLPQGTPSETAARIVLAYARDGRTATVAGN
jgi:lipid-A-disaccharide synthase